MSKKKTKPSSHYVDKWIDRGNLLGILDTRDDILNSCAERLDEDGVFETIGGGILFKAGDGKYYTVTLEPVISLADKNFVKERLTEI